MSTAKSWTRCIWRVPQAWNRNLRPGIFKSPCSNFWSSNWQEPDEGIWEIRGPRRHFIHSKVMAWVAFDRAVKDAERYGLEGPVDRWRQTRDAIHAQVCESGFDGKGNTFVQSYGSPHLDASLLLIPQVGFLPADDARVRGTIDAIERNLVVDGLVLRYATDTDVDALPGGEGVFLACSFWLADCMVLTGRRKEGRALFERLLALCNDVGLLAEEYDTRERCMLGNFPQALTHMALINTARLLSIPARKAKRASEKGERPAAAAPTSSASRPVTSGQSNSGPIRSSRRTTYWFGAPPLRTPAWSASTRVAVQTRRRASEATWERRGLGTILCRVITSDQSSEE